MVPSEDQVSQESKFSNPTHHYNWDNKQFDTVEATTLGGAYRAFTMSNPEAIVCAIEDLKLWNVPTIVG